MSDEYTLEESASFNDDEKTEFTLIPEDTVLESELLGMEKKTMPFKDDDGNDVVKVEWTFKVTQDGEFKNRRVWGQTSTVFTSHEDCKMRAWVQELLAVDELTPGFKFKTADLINNSARIVIGQRSWTDKKTNEPRTVNTVKDVIRSRQATAPVVDATIQQEEPVAAGAAVEEPF